MPKFPSTFNIPCSHLSPLLETEWDTRKEKKKTTRKSISFFTLAQIPAKIEVTTPQQKTPPVEQSDWHSPTQGHSRGVSKAKDGGHPCHTHCGNKLCGPAHCAKNPGG